MEEEVAYLPQQPHLFKASIRDNVSLFKDCQDSSVSNVLNTVGLDFNINDIPNGLSRGQIQRLGLARVLLISAKILILDEPTASVDLVTRQHIIKIIEDLRHYHSILIATHDPDLICHADFLINLDE